MRRVILLGASNLTMGFPRIRHALETAWPEPLELLAALGHGRSFGMWSRILHRELPGIVQCSLWEALQSGDSEPTETLALVTDVGNDLLYGASVEQIVEWVGTCLERLREHKAAVVLTRLPMGSVQKLSAWRYYATKALFFPTSRVSWEAIQQRAAELDERLEELGREYSCRLIEQPGEWYSLDPIHFRLTRRAEAWRTILSGWPSFPNEVALSGPPLRLRLEYAPMQPAERRVWGRPRQRRQPVLRNERITVALY